MSNAALDALVKRLEGVVARLEKVEAKVGGGSGGSGASAPQSSAKSLADFDAMVAENIPALVAATEKIGNDNVKKIIGLFQDAVKAHRAFLNIAAQAKKPSDADLPKLLKQTSDIVGAIISLRDSNRPDEMFNYLSAVSEGVPAFGWVGVSPTPAPFVNEYKGNSQFYSNKILVQHKNTDGGKDHVEWANKLTGFFAGLAQFIKDHHTTELRWKADGVDAMSLLDTSAAASTPAAAPAASKPAAASKPKVAGPGAAVKAGLFAELSKGTAISSGLKKVTKDMKTKNRPAEERSAVVKAVPKKTTTTRRFGGPVKKGPAVFELQGNKWVVENQDGNTDMKIEETETKQTVYVWKCDNSVLQISGKVNAITLDSCKKTGIVFENAVSVVEVINCQSVQIQVKGKVPSVTIDKTSGCQVFLSKDSLETEVVSSKSSEMNILIPTEDGNDVKELPIPEQYKTVVKDGNLVTSCTESI